MARKQIGIILLDVGSTMSLTRSHDKSRRIDDAKFAASQIIQSEMHGMKKQNLIGVVMARAKESNNFEHDEDEAEGLNVDMLHDAVLGNLDMIKDVEELDADGIDSADFGEAPLAVVEGLIDRRAKKLKFGKIVTVISDLECPMPSLQSAVENLLELGMSVNFIVVDLGSKEGADPVSKAVNEQTVTMLAQDNAGFVTVHNLEPKTRSRFGFIKKSVGAIAKVNTLELSDLVKLHVKIYSKTMEEKPPSMSKLSKIVVDSQGGDLSTTVGGKVKMDRTYRNPNNPDEEVEVEDRMQGFYYGNQCIPFGEADMDTLNYTADKAMQVIGFADEEYVEPKMRISTVQRVIANPDAPNSCAGFAALVEAMRKLRRVAIIRFVDKDKAKKAKLCALIADVREDPNTRADEQESLWLVQIPTDEDVRNFEFADLETPSSVPSQGQKDAAVALINDMDLGSGKDELFRPEDTFNPELRYLQACVHARGIDAHAGLPEPEDWIKAPLSANQDVIEKSKRSLDKFQELFPLKRAKQDTTDNSAEDFWGAEPTDATTTTTTNGTAMDGFVGGGAATAATGAGDWFQAGDTALVDSIGSVDPVSDLKAMLARTDKDLSDEAVRGMVAQIKAFVGPDGGAMFYPKALECLQALRVAALQCEAEEEFNEFMKQLKESLSGAGPTSFWHKMVDGEVKLISNIESNAVDVTPQQAAAFLTVMAVAPQAAAVPDAVVDDDDLMDDFE